MPRGGSREGAGRKPGMVSEAKRGLVNIAKGHAEDAVRVLVDIMKAPTESASARVSAAVALLDRGYGKPTQAVQHGVDPDNPLPASIAVCFVKPDEQN